MSASFPHPSLVASFTFLQVSAFHPPTCLILAKLRHIPKDDANIPVMCLPYVILAHQALKLLSPFRKIPLILSRHMACSVFLTFDFTSEGVLETRLPTSSFSPTPSHCCAEREVLACLPVTWSQLPKSAYMLTSVSQHVLCLTFHAVC